MSPAEVQQFVADRNGPAAELIRLGRLADAEAILIEARADAQQLDAGGLLPVLCACQLAQTHYALGKIDSADDLALQARADLQRITDAPHPLKAEILFVLGKIRLLCRDRPDELHFPGLSQCSRPPN